MAPEKRKQASRSSEKRSSAAAAAQDATAAGATSAGPDGDLSAAEEHFDRERIVADIDNESDGTVGLAGTAVSADNGQTPDQSSGEAAVPCAGDTMREDDSQSTKTAIVSASQTLIHEASAPGYPVGTTRREDHLLGCTIAGRYEIIELVGKGGMGSVYKAQDLVDARVVALKTLLPHLLEQEQSVKRFEREALSAKTLKHVNIAEVYECGVSPEGIPFIAMEYLEGRSLSDAIGEQGFFDYSRALPIFSQIAGALGHAHTSGIIHRDLKPGNVLLRDKDGHSDVVSIVDFGLAKLMPQANIDVSTLTNTGDVFGSPAYMSPEQCLGQKVDHRADIYSFGCLMYETLTGRLPLRGDTAVQTIMLQLHNVPPPMVEICPEGKIPAALEAIIFKALSKDAAARQQTMSEVQNELAKFSALQDAGMEYQPISISTQLTHIYVRRRKLITGAGAALALLLIYVGVCWWRWIHAYGEGGFHLFGSVALLVIVSYLALQAVRLHKKMRTAELLKPIWSMQWRLMEPAVTQEIPDLLEELRTFLAGIESGALITDRGRHVRLREVLAELVRRGWDEDIQYLCTHAIEQMRSRDGNIPDEMYLLKEAMADHLLLSGHVDRAKSAYSKVISEWSESDAFASEVRCSLHLKLADALFLQGETTEAATMYGSYLARWNILGMPHDAWFTLHLSRLADCHCAQESFKLAEKEYGEAMIAWDEVADQGNRALAFVKSSYTCWRRWRPVDSVRFAKEIVVIDQCFGAHSEQSAVARTLYSVCLWKEHQFLDAIHYRRSAEAISSSTVLLDTKSS